MQLIDIGVNLAHDSFDHDRVEVMDRARAAGVTGMVITGSCKASSHKARDLAREHPDSLAATAGVHPHHAKDFTDADAGWIRDLAGDPRVKAVGECGLDFWESRVDEKWQKQLFQEQLALADNHRLPVIVHARKALDDVISLLRRQGRRGGVIHSFTSSLALAEFCLDEGFMLGFNGIATFNRADNVREVIEATPVEQLLLETDAPYLTPSPERNRARRNEPAFVKSVLLKVAEVRQTDPATMAEITWQNTCRLYGL